jgi:solute carrier family 25 (peroxisomal adenine nucleotide transporter), member 17
MEVSLIHGISGGLSSMIATCILHPLETLRVKMQAETENVYFLRFIRKTYREEGIRGIYSGFASSIVMAVASYSSYFFCYKWIKGVILRRKGKFGVLDDIYANFLASWIVIAVNTPVWTINTRLQKDNSKSFREVFYQILYKEGPAAFYKGAGLSVLLSVNPVIQYSFYEYLKKKLRMDSWFGYFIMGAIAKFVATVMTYPMLTLRTRIQLNEKENKSLLDGIFHLFANSLRDNFREFVTLYNGFMSKALQTVLNSAIILSLHEKITNLLMRKLNGPRGILIN